MGLTQVQLALLLGVSHMTILAWEASPEKVNHNQISGPACKLMRYFVQGYRPDDWPKVKEAPEVFDARKDAKTEQY